MIRMRLFEERNHLNMVAYAQALQQMLLIGQLALSIFAWIHFRRE